MQYFAKSDIGKQRKNNEDNFYAANNFFAVADGMGGHNAGEVASKIAIDSFSEIFFKKLREKEAVLTPKKSAKDEEKISGALQKILIDSLKHANKKIYQEASRNNEFSGMGTTFTAVYLFGNEAFAIHTGDSRLYLFREDEIKLLTEDHTLVFALYKEGAISYDDMFSHPKRNYLTGILGEKEISSLECFKFTLQSDDLLLLCSDGLNSMIRDEEIKKTIVSIKNEPAETIADALIEKANKNGGIDNITVLVIKND